MILRMGLLAAALIVRTERVPFLVRHDARETERGQDHHALGHPRDPMQQDRDRGRGRGDSGSDGESLGPLFRPPLGEPAEQTVSPVGQFDVPEFRQPLRPLIDDRPQPLERNLPMQRQFGRVRGGVGEAARIDLFDQQQVERPREVLRQPQRLGAVAAVAPNQLRKR